MNKPLTIGELLTARKDIVKAIDELNAVLKVQKEDLQQIEQTLHARMVDSGIEKTGIEGVVVWIKHDITAKVISWEAVYAYINEKKMNGLLQKRINSNAFKDLVNAGEIPPGIEVESFEKLAFRKV